MRFFIFGALTAAVGPARDVTIPVLLVLVCTAIGFFIWSKTDLTRLNSTSVMTLRT